MSAQTAPACPEWCDWRRLPHIEHRTTVAYAEWTADGTAHDRGTPDVITAVDVAQHVTGSAARIEFHLHRAAVNGGVAEVVTFTPEQAMTAGWVGGWLRGALLDAAVRVLAEAERCAA